MRKARRLEPPSFSNSNSIGATIRAKYIVVNGIRIASDFEPETFGRLTTIGPRFIVGRRVYQVCICNCSTVGVYRVDQLKNKHTKSCGCLHKDRVEAPKLYADNRYIRTKEYRTWISMKTRCYRENTKAYSDYGARGIKICDRWLKPAVAGL